MALELTTGMKNVSLTHQEEPPLNIGNYGAANRNDSMDISVISLSSNEAIDMNESIAIGDVDVKPSIKLEPVDFQEVLPMVYPVLPPPPIVREQKKKQVEQPVRQRNNGRIGIGNLQRRRLLSMSAASAAEYFRRRTQRLSQSNRSQSVPRTPQAPVRINASKSITVPQAPLNNVNNQLAPVSPTYGQGFDGVASNPRISVRAESPQQDEPEEPEEPDQQQQQQQQQEQQHQQLQVLLNQMNSGTFCEICQQQFSSRQGLRQHRKSKKHDTASKNVDPARQQLLNLAYAQINGN